MEAGVSAEAVVALLFLIIQEQCLQSNKTSNASPCMTLLTYGSHAIFPSRKLHCFRDIPCYLDEDLSTSYRSVDADSSS